MLKFFFSLLLLSIASKTFNNLISELSESQEQMLNNVIIRRFIVFTIAFIATRDVYVSLILTSIFIVLVSNLFNENSSYCILRKGKNKKMFNNISKTDYEKAKSVIKLYDLQRKNN